jgi:hypothetical protein
MSSPSPSNKPYKSRLFNFVNRHYIKFNSRINVKFREFGYVAKTGLQTLVFPLFWLWETTKKISKTFSSASSSVSSSLTDSSPPKTLTSGDDLIKTVNQAINLHPQLTSFPVKNFQGFASRIKDKHIICILEKNKFTDIIPIDKQEEVNNIINNISDKLTKTQLLNSASSSNFFSRFLAWFNIFGQSKIEVKISQDINNLNESDLVLHNQSSSNLFLPKTNNLISFIDSFFAILESITFLGDHSISIHDQNISNSKGKIINGENQDNNIADYSQALKPEVQKKISILLLIQQAINYFLKRGNNQNNLRDNNIIINDKLTLKDKNNSSLPFKDLENNNYIQSIIIRSQDSVENIIPLLQNTTEKLINQSLNKLNIVRNNLNNKLDNPDDPFQIKILIWAAINYFFNDKNKHNNLSYNNNILPSFSETEIIVINEEVADPWLSWEDLYGYNALPDSSLNNNFFNFIDNNEEIITETQELLIEPSSDCGMPTVLRREYPHQENDKIVETKNNSKNIIVREEKTVKLEKETVILEEIEAKIIEIKYEKHFLEIILEKLDQFILWLEENIIKIINKIKSLVQK